MTSFRELPRRVKGIVPFSGILSNIPSPYLGRDISPTQSLFSLSCSDFETFENYISGHCEERSDVAISCNSGNLEIASLRSQ